MTIETQAAPLRYLLDRGFTEDVIHRVGWRLERIGAECCSRYGLPIAAAEANAWFIPYPHSNGHIAFERLRLIAAKDLERFGGGKYRQPKGRPLALYDPFLALAKPQDGVLLVEGEANAVAAHVANPGLAVIGVPGQTGLTEAMARELGHIQQAWIWIDRHDKGAPANAKRMAKRLRDAGVEEVRQVADAVGLDANDALKELGPERFSSTLREMIDRAESIATIMDAGEDWPDLSSPGVPFPLDALPSHITEFVAAVAVETQTPPDLAAMCALSVLSAAALGSATVVCDPWEEELGLYLLAVMDTGDRKSSVLRSVMAPLRGIERERCAEASVTVRERRLRKEVLQARKSKLARKAGEEDNKIERLAIEEELAEVAVELEEVGEPEMPRLLADDATPEALSGLLARHGRMAILTAEAAVVDNLIGRYDASGAANLHLVCKAWSGEEIWVDRRNREAEHLDRPLLTMMLVVQPHVLDGLVGHGTARAQGLVGRFAYAMPESLVGRRDVQPPSVSPSLHQTWDQTVRNVASSVLTLTQPTEPPTSLRSDADTTDTTRTQGISVGSVSTLGVGILRLSLSPSARDLLIERRAAQEPRLSEDGDLHAIKDWVARDAGRVARIATLLHLASSPRTAVIDAGTLGRALLIGDYLLEQARVALNTPDDTSRRALRWLRRQGVQTITQRDLHRGPLAGRGSAEAAEQLAIALVEQGALRRLPDNEPRAPGRPASPTYAINPNLRDPR